MLEERKGGGGFRDRSLRAERKDDGNPEQMENENRYRQGEASSTVNILISRNAPTSNTHNNDMPGNLRSERERKSIIPGQP